MQTLTLWGLVATLLAATLTVSPMLVEQDDAGQVAFAQEDGDDGNRGHGNDEDGDDEDNPGRGNGGNNGNQGQGDDNDDNSGVGNANDQVAPAEDYRVEVTCDYVGESDRTTCTFTGVAPPDAKDVSHVDLAEEAVCAEVVGGEYEYVDPDPNTHVTGYKSRGSEGTFTLILAGEVSTSGSTTYWFKSGEGVFPAAGPGLLCGEVEAAVSTVETGKIVTGGTPAADTGTLIVETYSCTGVPEDRTGFDWFGKCEPSAEALTFKLAPTAAEIGEDKTAETGTSGEATFESLPSGNYMLDAVDASWCHAKSDNVTAEGDLVVEPSASTSVWIFMCPATADGV